VLLVAVRKQREEGRRRKKEGGEKEKEKKRKGRTKRKREERGVGAIRGGGRPRVCCGVWPVSDGPERLRREATRTQNEEM
jgi:hypothetical protein